MVWIAYVHAPSPYADTEQVVHASLRDRPVAVIDTRQFPPRIVDCSWEAARSGVRPGMGRRQAYLACPVLHLAPLHPERLTMYLERVWEAATHVGPAVEPDGTEGLFVELADTDARGHVADPASGALPPLLVAARQALPIRWSLGIGPSKLVAKAAALMEAERQWASGQPELPTAPAYRRIGTTAEDALLAAAAFMKGLPLRWLWLCPPGIRQQLTWMGFHTAGELRSVPVDALVQRFGVLGWQLSRWVHTGLDGQPVLPLYPPPVLERRLDLETLGCTALLEQGMSQLFSVLQGWALEMVKELQSRHLASDCWQLDLTLRPSGLSGPATPSTFSRNVRPGVGVPAPDLLAHRLRTLFTQVVAQAAPWLTGGASPTGLRLAALSLRPARFHQTQPAGILDTDPARPGSDARAERLQQALLAVEQRLGPGRIRRSTPNGALSRREAMLALIEEGWHPA